MGFFCTCCSCSCCCCCCRCCVSLRVLACPHRSGAPAATVRSVVQKSCRRALRTTLAAAAPHNAKLVPRPGQAMGRPSVQTKTGLPGINIPVPGGRRAPRGGPSGPHKPGSGQTLMPGSGPRSEGGAEKRSRSSAARGNCTMQVRHKKPVSSSQPASALRVSASAAKRGGGPRLARRCAVAHRRLAATRTPSEDAAETPGMQNVGAPDALPRGGVAHRNLRAQRKFRRWLPAPCVGAGRGMRCRGARPRRQQQQLQQQHQRTGLAAPS